ncbi:MAG: putative poly-gamma-glutamate biosynthesis enzyme [Rhodocyclales bacterium]|nr:putative poly-gamma-glutamate biosynthesis enzyme [Rhodocyclales bacterium]
MKRRGFLKLFGSMLLLALHTPPGAAAAESLQLVFTGDVMLDDGPGKVIASGRDPLINFAQLLAQSDYAIGNLECPVATTGTAMASKIFTFRAEPRSVDYLKGRYQALSVANNHAGDYGKAAFVETLEHLKANGLAYFGGGRNLTEAHSPLWIVRNGVKIAVLGYDEFKPRSFEAGPDWPGVAWSEDSQVVADIRAARAAGADLIIPMMHWGWERESQPSARQRQLARTMIDAGADLVVGAHPHITQGAEYYRGKLIVYSLGNFVFDSFTTDATRTGWLLRLNLDKRGLISWDTVGAFMDEEGVPQRMPGAATPCGKAGDKVPRLCVNQ